MLLLARAGFVGRGRVGVLGRARSAREREAEQESEQRESGRAHAGTLSCYRGAVEASASSARTHALSAILDELITPALVIDLDAVDHNIAAMLRHTGGPARWRPHLKTNKQAVVIAALLAQGVECFKVATLDELALALDSAAGRRCDVLIAHPLTRPAFEASRRLAAAHANARVQWLADSPEHLDALTSWARHAPLLVALDVDLGMARTGTPPQVWHEWLAQAERARRVVITALHGYDGHLRSEQRELAHAGYDRLLALAEAAAARELVELARLDIVTSGTHSFSLALAHPGLARGPARHQVSPGTIVLSDRRSAHAAAELGLRQAAFVASRVISRGAGRVTLDAGSKSITPDGEPPVCEVVDHPELVPLRASEEHLPCRLAAGALAPPLGELVWLIPDHVCTTVNLHREALWIRGDRLVGRGPIVSGHRFTPPLAGGDALAGS